MSTPSARDNGAAAFRHLGGQQRELTPPGTFENCSDPVTATGLPPGRASDSIPPPWLVQWKAVRVREV